MKPRLHSLIRPLQQLKYSGTRNCQFRNVSSTTGFANQHAAPMAGGPQDNFVLKSNYAPSPLPEGGVTQYILEKCAPFMSRNALVDGVTGASLTYGVLVDHIHRWGAVVQSRTRAGCSPPTVAVYMNNSIDFPSIFFGTMGVGGVVTPLNPAYTPAEVARQIEDSGAELLVVDTIGERTAIKALDILRELRKKDPAVPIPEMFVIGSSSTGISDLRSLLTDKGAAFATPVEVLTDSVAILPYSSGTTGKPKGVSIKHGAMTACIEMVANAEFYPDAIEGSPDKIVGMLPFYHIYGILGVMANSLKNGLSIAVLSGFQKDHFINMLRTYKPTILPTVPPILKFLIESGEVTREDLESVHTVFCGAAPVSKNSVEKYLAKTGGTPMFGEGYGMTEILITHATPRSDMKVGFCGKMLPHVQARVVSTETGQNLPAEERGELLVKTPGMMAGYHNNPKATSETIDEDGWLHTGDIVKYTEDGFFSIVDRIKELIKVKGLQVSPSELEDVLLKHPGVADVGVVGVPHDRHGEVPRAYIIKSSRQDVSIDEISRYMEKQLSAHKQLVGGVKFVTELPKNPTGKLLRRVLKESAEKEG